MTTLTVRKVGNSLGIVIPKAQAQELGLHPGDTVDVELRKTAPLSSIFGAMRGQFGDLDALMREIDEGDDA